MPLTALHQDIRYAVRGFRRAPVFTLAAILTLALGIGASTAVFSVVDRILFRPLPYPDSARLVSIGMLSPRADTNEFLMVPAYLQFRDRQAPFSAMGAFAFTSDCDLTSPNPVRLRCTQVDAAFLPAFGIQPLAGRNFTAAEDTPTAPKVAILTWGFWTRRFAADASVIGRSLPIDGQPVTILGVLPRDFELFNLSPTDLVLPAALLRTQAGRAVRAFARLKPGITIEQARAAIEPLFADSLQSVPPELRAGVTLVVRPLRDRQIWTVRTATWTLLAAVLLVLLMACANVANLLLARSAGRRRERAIRHALGAGRARLVAQALTESFLLAGAGAAAGCSLAWVLLRAFVAIAPHSIPRLEQASLDPRVLAFTVLLSAVCGILFGLAPAIERPDDEALAGGRSVASFRGFLRQALITAQIAASLVLLTGAGLLLRTLWSLDRVPLGLDPAHVMTARLVLSRTYTPARLLAFYEGLETRLRPLDAAIASTIPPYGGVSSTPYSALNIEGRPRLPEGTGGAVAWRSITPEYFHVLGIPILRGRAFEEQDRAPDASAIILGQALARRLFGDENPIGKHIFQSQNGAWHTVVGVAGNVLNNGLTDSVLAEYYAVRRHSAADPPGNAATVVVRSPLPAASVAALLRARIAELDPALPVETETMEQRVAALTGGPRFNATLLAGFAAVGLLLAAIGIYGVIAFLVGQRTREVGVRMALGAAPSAVVRLFLGHAARWTLAGISLGIAGSLAATRLLHSLLFAAPVRDLAGLAAPAAILFFTALAAAWLPARRAARIDPLRSLREE